MSHQNWEYKVIFEENILTSKELNEHGNRGWELCGIVQSTVPLSSNLRYVFKRPQSSTTYPLEPV
jgi:hypothetical protein